jgi:hypothetical protein
LQSLQAHRNFLLESSKLHTYDPLPQDSHKQAAPTLSERAKLEDLSPIRPWHRGFLLGKKLTAFGFIVVILAGNFWMIEYIFLQRTAAAVEWTFFAGFSFAFLGGITMLLCAMARYLKEVIFTK